jgi:hypothetical protein
MIIPSQCGQTKPAGWRCRSSQIMLRLSSNRSAIGKSVMPIVYHVRTLPGHEPLVDTLRFLMVA